MSRVAFLESNLSGSGIRALALAKELGHHVTFLTMNPQRYLTSIPGAPEVFESCVDDVVICDTRQPQATLEGIAGRRFDALLAIGEYHVRQAAEIASRLGLPGPSPEAVGLARNKLWARDRCAAAGIPIPAFRGAASPLEVAAATDAIGIPCVVKPVDEASSVDVLICRSQEQAVAHGASLLSSPINTRGFARYPSILVEEYMVGIEVSVELFVHDGVVTTLGVTDKLLAGTPYFVEVGHTFPSGLPLSAVEVCVAVARDAVAAIGYDFGAAHVEVKFTRDGPKLIEVNARAAGDRIPDLIEESIGINLLQEVIRLYCGEPPNLRRTRERGAAIRFLVGQPGIVSDVDGLDLAGQVPGLRELFISVGVGDRIRPLTCSHDRIGHAITVADSSYEAGLLAEAALGQIQIRTSPAETAPDGAHAAPRVLTAGS